VLLDQLVLEQQRLLHVARDEDFDRGGPLHEGRNPDPPVAPGDVLAHAGLQVLRLADVEHGSLVALEKVDPGLVREPVGLIFETRPRGLVGVHASTTLFPLRSA